MGCDSAIRSCPYRAERENMSKVVMVSSAASAAIVLFSGDIWTFTAVALAAVAVFRYMADREQHSADRTLKKVTEASVQSFDEGLRWGKNLGQLEATLQTLV